MTGVNLYATNLYGKIASQEVQATPFANAQNTQKIAGQFQNIAKAEFNKLSNVNPAQLASGINIAQNIAGSPALSVNIPANLLAGMSDLRQNLIKQEKESRKAAIGKANFTGLMTATVQSQNLLTTIVTLRDKMVEAWDKVMSMQI